jgi:hypothetical protein
MWFSASAYFAILSGLYSFGLFVRPFPPILIFETQEYLTQYSSQPSSKTSALPKTPTKSNYGPSSRTPLQP